MKNRLCVLVLALFVTIVGDAAPALATDIVDYCSWHYADVDAVFWSTQSSVPAEMVGTDWTNVETYVGNYLQRLISNNVKDTVYSSKIPVIKATESPEKILSAHPKSLYVNVVFSYAPKEAFTTPLIDDALVIWIETTRYEPNETHSGTIPVKKVVRNGEFFIISKPVTFNGKLFGSPFFFGPDKLLTRVGCDVLKNSSDKICTNVPNPAENKVVLQTAPPCVK